MKYFLAFMLGLVIAANARSQTFDSIPPFQKDSTLPVFSIMQTDSSWFNNLNLPKNKQVVMLYFSPECGHCQLTAHEFMKDAKRFKDVFFVWVSYQPMEEIKTFADNYKMLKAKNIAVGRDPKYYIPSFFRVKYTPFIAAYNKDGKLIAAFDGGTDTDTVYDLLYPKEK